MVPCGQGMNARFEDFAIFYNLLEQFDNDLQKAATKYSETRWKDSHAITDHSLSNYMEMCAHFNNWNSLLHVYLDNTLHALFPRTFMPVETMLAFTRLPYHSVLKQSQRQRNIINKTLLIIAISSVGVLGYATFRYLR